MQSTSKGSDQTNPMHIPHCWKFHVAALCMHISQIDLMSNKTNYFDTEVPFLYLDLNYITNIYHYYSTHTALKFD